MKSLQYYWIINNFTNTIDLFFIWINVARFENGLYTFQIINFVAILLLTPEILLFY